MKKRMTKLALHRETVAALDPATAKQVAGGLTNATACCTHYATEGGVCTGIGSGGLNNCTNVD